MGIPAMGALLCSFFGRFQKSKAILWTPDKRALTISQATGAPIETVRDP